MSATAERTIDADQRRAAAVGALAGALPAGLLLEFASGGAIGDAVGVGGPLAGWLAWFAGCLVLAGPFLLGVSRTIDDVTALVFALTRRSALLRRAMVGLLSRSALATTTAGMGLGYGAVLGVGYGLALPLWANAVGGTAAVSRFAPAGLAAFLVYGLLMGAGYGLLLESGRLA